MNVNLNALNQKKFNAGTKSWLYKNGKYSYIIMHTMQ